MTAAQRSAAGIDGQSNSKYGSRRYHANDDPFDF
jgi:hypothetical protein